MCGPVPARRQRVGDFFARLEQGGADQGVLMDVHRTVATVGRSDDAQLSPPVGFREHLLLVAGLVTRAVGHDPDLQEVHG